MATPIRIIIADDHALFRQGLRSLLRHQPEIEVIAEIDNTLDLEPVLSASQCDMLLLDLQMDAWSMDHIAWASKRTRVIVLTASESTEHAVRALRLGAKAIVHKRFAIESLMTAIRTVADGLVWMPPSVQTEFATQQNSNSPRLTARESEIVRCVASGMRNSQVAEKLSISESTVKPISTTSSKSSACAIAWGLRTTRSRPDSSPS
jgi:two-component system NarL family response regulator